MAKREKMTIDERYKLIRNVKRKYLQACRKNTVRCQVHDEAI